MFPDQQNQNGGVPQQNAQGHYDVVPPLPVGQNAGHSGHNPYEFIVNPAVQHKTAPLGLPGGSFFGRIAVVVGGAVVLILIGVVATSLLAPKSPTADLTAIAQRQQEIIRLSSAAESQATSQDTKNFAANLDLAVSSSQAQVTGYLASHGTKLKPKVLAMDQTAQTDSLLANAITTNTYDSAVLQVLSGQLATYQSLLKNGYNQASSKTVKKILQQGYTATGLLAEQAKTAQK